MIHVDWLRDWTSVGWNHPRLRDGGGGGMLYFDRKTQKARYIYFFFFNKQNKNNNNTFRMQNIRKFQVGPLFSSSQRRDNALANDEETEIRSTYLLVSNEGVGEENANVVVVVVVLFFLFRAG